MYSFHYYHHPLSLCPAVVSKYVIMWTSPSRNLKYLTKRALVPAVSCQIGTKVAASAYRSRKGNVQTRLVHCAFGFPQKSTIWGKIHQVWRRNWRMHWRSCCFCSCKLTAFVTRQPRHSKIMHHLRAALPVWFGLTKPWCTILPGLISR